MSAFDDKKNELVSVIEGQLIIAEQMRNKLIEFENTKKEIDAKEDEIKSKLKDLMKANGISSYESNDKKIKISYVDDKPDTIETINYIDEDAFVKENEELYKKYTKIHNEYILKQQEYKKQKQEIVKGKKGYVRITIRDDKEMIKEIINGNN